MCLTDISDGEENRRVPRPGINICFPTSIPQPTTSLKNVDDITTLLQNIFIVTALQPSLKQNLMFTLHPSVLIDQMHRYKYGNSYPMQQQEQKGEELHRVVKGI
jgi:hypothetical protein